MSTAFAPADWSELLRLLDLALDIAPTERAGWLHTLDTRPAMRDKLVELLQQRAAIETDDFLDALPALPVGTNVVDHDDDNDGLEAGSEVGPYRLLRRIGVGGMGTVWLAQRRDGTVDRQVALKLPRTGLRRQALARRLAQEGRILATLEHPNIARLYDAGITDDGTPYIALEYVAGEPIGAWCDARRLDVAGRLHLFLQVLDAVQYAHGRLVLHRDLKPANVLVTPAGGVKLLDFGIAKLIDSDDAGGGGGGGGGGAGDGAAAGTESPTEIGHRMLTPDYAAPEQIDGLPLGTGCDIYALGVLLHELLIGARPYKSRAGSALRPAPTPGGATASASALAPISAVEPGSTSRSQSGAESPSRQRAERPGRPTLQQRMLATSTARPSMVARHGVDAARHAAARSSHPVRLARALRGDIDVILRKAMNEAPAERYATAQAYGDDIRRHLNRVPIAARRDRLWYRLQKLVLRNRIATGAMAVALMALAIGGGATLWQSRQLAAEAHRSRLAYDFMAGLFEQNDPQHAQGRQLTALQLLDAGAEHLDDQFADEPVALAELHSRIGRVYLRMGQFQAAILHTRRAVAVYEQLGGRPIRPYLDALELAVVTLYNAARLDGGDSAQEAARMARHGLAVSAAELGRHNAYNGPFLAMLAWADVANGHLQAAIADLRAAEAEQVLGAGKSSGDWVAINVELARQYLRTGQVVAARDAHLENLRLLLTFPNADLLNVLTSIHSLAKAEQSLSEYALAEQVAHRLPELTETLSGERSMDAVTVRANVTRTLMELGRYRDARASLAVLRTRLDHATLGPDDRQHFESEFARNLRLQGDVDASLPLAASSAAYFERPPLRLDPARTASVLILGQSLLAAGRVDQAVAVLDGLKHSVAGSEEVQSLWYQELLTSSALAERAAGDMAAAAADLRTACPRIDASVGPQRWAALRCRAIEAWVAAERAPGDAAAVARFVAARIAVAAKIPAGHPLNAELMEAEARLAGATGRAGEAARLHASAEASYRNALGRDLPSTLTMLH